MSPRSRRMKLRPRFVLFVLVGVAVVAGAMAMISYYDARALLLDSRQLHLWALAKSESAELSRRLQSVTGIPTSLATTLEVIGLPSEKEIDALLKGHLDENPKIYGMAMAFAPNAYRPGLERFCPYVYRSPNGLKRVCLDSESYNYPKHNWYRIPASTSLPHWSEPYFDEGGGQVPMTTYSVPILRDGKVLGVVTADIQLSDLESLVSVLPVGRSGFSFVLTRKGTFLAAPDKHWIMREGIFSLAKKWKRPELAKLGKRMVRGFSGVFRVKGWRDGESAWMAFAPVKGVGWTFGVMAPEGEVLSPVQRLAQHQFMWAGAGLAVMAVVIMIMVMGLTRPLNRLIHGARRLAAGDLSTRVTDVRPGDELGEMAEAFNSMASDMENQVEELKQKKAEVEKALKKIELLETIESHMAKFVPETVKEQIKDSPQEPHLEKRAMDVSVLFLDIAGYTRMSENVAAGKMNFLLESYFSSFLDDIYKNHGDINETAGDGLMIIFKDADPQRHALNALNTAIAIQSNVRQVNDDLEGFAEPVDINIGINSGEAMVGSSRFEGIGGDRWTYTATGPVTNIASRIGALAINGQTLLGQETADRVEGLFEIKELGPKELKNVSEPVMVYELVLDGEGDEKTAEA